LKTLADVAAAVGGRLDGPPERTVRRVAPVEDAGPDDLVFVKDERWLARLASSGAGAVLCREGDDVGGRPAIRVANPRLAAAQAAALLVPPPPWEPLQHPTALVERGAAVPASCALGPYAVVGRDAVLGERVRVGAHAVVGAGCRVGDDSQLDPHVVLYPGVVVGARCALHAGAVIGAPGFGYEMGPDGPVGVPQTGTVILGDDVRIGANTTVDRAAFRATRLGDGVKIDNLVQVAHNVTVEAGVIICALAGIGGGATLGPRSVVGPQGALAPDASLGGGTILGARAALASGQHLDAPGRVFMSVGPVPFEDWKRWVVFRRRFARGRGPRGAPPA
jgi:UDP-3-O-[3-hydroxymyristoyl] glucosamine N-acyltransferase